jgi:hypothetical protein
LAVSNIFPIVTISGALKLTPALLVLSIR